jgi:small subunit ribosomal protein S2
LADWERELLGEVAAVTPDSPVAEAPAAEAEAPAADAPAADDADEASTDK